MANDVRVAVIYHSATGSVHELANAVVQGAEETGAQVRLRRVAELAPESAIDANPAWREHVDATRDSVTEATMDDLEWGNAYAFGSPTRYGLPTAQLKQFMDSTGGLWFEGKLADKPVTSFTSAMNNHGGQESTTLALNNVFYHWGCIIVPPGFTDPSVFEAGGNPYGTCWASGQAGDSPNEAAMAAARYQGKRLAEFAAKLM